MIFKNCRLVTFYRGFIAMTLEAIQIRGLNTVAKQVRHG